MKKILVIASLCLLCATTPTAFATDKVADARAKLQRMSEATNLNDGHMSAWHWKVDLTLYGKAQASTSGSIESWIERSNMKTVFTLNGAKITTLRLNDKLFRSGGDAVDFATLDAIFMQMLEPIPPQVMSPTIKPVIKAPSSGEVKLQCVVYKWIVDGRLPVDYLNDPVNYRHRTDTADGVDVLLPVTQAPVASYCSPSASDALVSETLPAGLTVNRTRVGTFQAKQVVLEANLNRSREKFAQIKTVALNAFTPDANFFSVTPELHPIDRMVTLPTSDVPGWLLFREQPATPNVARQRIAGGDEVVDVLVQQDGKIVEQHEIDVLDPALSVSTRESLSRWIYRPYLLNGLPVSVRTKVTVHFDNDKNR